MNIAGSTFNSGNTAAVVFSGLTSTAVANTEEFTVPETVTNTTITD